MEIIEEESKEVTKRTDEEPEKELLKTQWKLIKEPIKGVHLMYVHAEFISVTEDDNNLLWIKIFFEIIDKAINKPIKSQYFVH